VAPTVPPPSSPTASARPISSTPEGAELEQIRRVLSSKLLELRKFQTEREALLARLAERDARVHELERASPNESERLRARVKDLEAQLERARQRAESAEAERDRSRVLAAELEARLDRTEPLGPRVPTQLEELREAKLTIARLEQELSDSLAWEAPAGDDLKRIPGIGPKYEKALNELGIRTFAQIAAWTLEDVERMAAKLKVHRARMEKSDWVGEAAKLARKE
jgi:predicted flap endonuclease-1-like 5' DNA nuclease